MYEIWSLGHKPFENCSGTEVCIAIVIYYCSYITTISQCLVLLTTFLIVKVS